MWGLFSNKVKALEGHMSEAYRKKTLNINLAFFLLILASFTFINLIFIKSISNFNNNADLSELITVNAIKNSYFNQGDDLHLYVVGEESSNKSFYEEKIRENKLILFGLNLLFFFIVIYTIGSFTFTINSMKTIEERFMDQLEKNIELQQHFKEKSRYIRHRFKRKLIDLKSKKNNFMSSIRDFLDEYMGESQSSIHLDELKNLRLNLHMNKIGAWSWDVKQDMVKIDNACSKLLNLNNKSSFVGGYSLFLNFFDRISRRKLKKDIAYAVKSHSSFETQCSLKNNYNSKGLILKGNLIYDSDNKAQKIQGVLLETECPSRTSEYQKQFLNQPIALFAILDRDFCFEFLNPAWLDSTGYSTHELKNSPMFNFIHQREKRLFLNNLHVLKQDNDSSVKSLRYRFRLGDGNFVVMNMMVSYENYRYYILATPINEKKEVRKTEFDFNFQESWDQQYLKS